MSGGPILSLTGLPQLILRFDVMVPGKWLYLVRLRESRDPPLLLSSRALPETLHYHSKEPLLGHFSSPQSGFNKTRMSLGLRSLLEFQLRP